MKCKLLLLCLLCFQLVVRADVIPSKHEATEDHIVVGELQPESGGGMTGFPC